VIDSISRIKAPILAALTSAGTALLLIAAPGAAQASTGHYVQCTKVAGVWVIGVDPNGYMCALQFRARSGIAYERVTGETGAFTWYRVGSTRITASGTQIPVSSPNVVYVGVNGTHPYLLIPHVLYAWDSTGTYDQLRTPVGLALKLATNGLVSEFPVKKVSPPGATTQIAWG
jgi:hypothetical protein